MKSICVFCGSNTGFSPLYVEMAQELGRLFVERDIRLIYGGGNVGLMGAMADEMLKHGGKVTGVIPHFLMEKEVGHTGLEEQIVVDTMHIRKQKMADMSEGFIAMPGGFGTMDELNEILTWAQLGLHSHPIGVLNVGQYYDHLLGMFDHMVDQGFLHADNRGIVLDSDNAVELLAKMAAYEAPETTKWLTKGQE